MSQAYTRTPRGRRSDDNMSRAANGTSNSIVIVQSGPDVPRTINQVPDYSYAVQRPFGVADPIVDMPLDRHNNASGDGNMSWGANGTSNNISIGQFSGPDILRTINQGPEYLSYEVQRPFGIADPVVDMPLDVYHSIMSGSRPMPRDARQPSPEFDYNGRPVHPPAYSYTSTGTGLDGSPVHPPAYSSSTSIHPADRGSRPYFGYASDHNVRPSTPIASRPFGYATEYNVRRLYPDSFRYSDAASQHNHHSFPRVTPFTSDLALGNDGRPVLPDASRSFGQRNVHTTHPAVPGPFRRAISRTDHSGRSDASPHRQIPRSARERNYPTVENLLRARAEAEQAMRALRAHLQPPYSRSYLARNHLFAMQESPSLGEETTSPRDLLVSSGENSRAGSGNDTQSEIGDEANLGPTLRQLDIFRRRTERLLLLNRALETFRLYERVADGLLFVPPATHLTRPTPDGAMANEGYQPPSPSPSPSPSPPPSPSRHATY